MYRSAALGLLVVLAGCSVGPGSSAAIDETVTPAPRPTIETGAQSAGEPWLLEGPRIDTSALVDRHEAVLADRAHRVTINSTVEKYGQNVPNVRIVENSTTWFFGDAVAQQVETRHLIPRDRSREDWWVNSTSYQVNGDRYVRRSENGTTTTTVHRAVKDPYVDSADVVERILTVETAAADRVRYNGTVYYLIDSTETEAPSLRWAADYRLTVLIDQSGFVRRIATNYSYEQFGKYRRVSYRMTVERIDPSDIPDWQQIADFEGELNGTEAPRAGSPTPAHP